MTERRSALEAVARTFSATLDEGSDPRDVVLTVAGKRVAVDVVQLNPRGTENGDGFKPRLRFDKVATRLIDRLRATLGETAPAGVTAIVTVTAPIRLPSKTAAALEERMHALLKRRGPQRDVIETIHDNRIRIRVVNGEPDRPPQLIGFVHNPDSDPLLLLNAAHDVLDLFTIEPAKPSRRHVSDRWLIAISAHASSHSDAYRSEAYRCIGSQLSTSRRFDKILVAFSDGHVETLASRSYHGAPCTIIRRDRITPNFSRSASVRFESPSASIPRDGS